MYTDVRDDARPFFVRNPGEIGIYIDIIDAVPMTPKDYGSHHYFVMSVLDQLYECIGRQEFVAIKGRMEKHGLMSGVILERFQKGIVLAVSFNDQTCLERLVDDLATGRLCAMFQDVFVDKTVLSTSAASKVRVRTKIWPDEWEPCMEEIRLRSRDIKPLVDLHRDLELLRTVREYQRELVHEVMKIRDSETKIEQSLGEMIHSIKQVIPPRITHVDTLKEFLKYSKMALARPGASREVIQTYMDLLDCGKVLFREMDKRICHTLAQVHGVCEKEKQKRLKNEIKDTCKRMCALLRKDSDIGAVVYGDWQGKILHREQGLFLGAISLVPMIVDGVLEMDHKTDEYISEFPDEI